MLFNDKYNKNVCVCVCVVKGHKIQIFINKKSHT